MAHPIDMYSFDLLCVHQESVSPTFCLDCPKEQFYN